MGNREGCGMGKFIVRADDKPLKRVGWVQFHANIPPIGRRRRSWGGKIGRVRRIPFRRRERGKLNLDGAASRFQHGGANQGQVIVLQPGLEKVVRHTQRQLIFGLANHLKRGDPSHERFGREKLLKTRRSLWPENERVGGHGWIRERYSQAIPRPEEEG